MPFRSRKKKSESHKKEIGERESAGDRCEKALSEEEPQRDDATSVDCSISTNSDVMIHQERSSASAATPSTPSTPTTTTTAICELNNSEISSNHDSCSNPMRRSIRDPALAQLDRSDVRNLLAKIHENHPETIILKIKNQLHADINSHVMDAIIAALNKNRVCQALYAQNLTKALGETQLAEITKLCSKKKIWCVNLGENYNISTLAWERFCRDLATTFITHLYVSEHTINIELKNRMRDQIRANRKKHELHCSMKNIAVIEKCTNMWWNPINSIKHQLEASARALELKQQEELALKKRQKRRKLQPHELTPFHTQYWVDNSGTAGGEKPWKFACKCGEVCSSFENYRYHPVGRMFECTRCSLWSHVSCVLGEISDEVLEEIEDALCARCHTEVRRRRLAEMRELKLEYRGGEIITKLDEAQAEYEGTSVDSLSTNWHSQIKQQQQQQHTQV